ncbi:Tricarboxylate/iron carrier [Dioszegia hungarica]|uniref:Tricarboxylate/iron carrier n=1 Tax=Dioszegia hungarica TaxID=4972 RepID=A0AA38HB28_9TREE|nr:Tricarboxylate/iron carrier [Dioszegia hungarica]KAI9636214.1 Tricarboxylate/iron carrier [Dioszegia hungarica]
MAQENRFDISKPRFDLETYSGRLRYFYSTTSPLTLLASSAKLEQAQHDVKRYEGLIKERGREGYWVGEKERDEYWKAKQLTNSSLHPDTGKPVPLPFRMSAFVPTNLIICAGMLMPNASLRSVIFWQWANQTLNVAVNYSNANKSIVMTPQEVGTAYLAATFTSVFLAVSLTRLVPRLPVSLGTKQILSRLVPFASVASAGVVNISCIRWKEMRDGVEVYKLRRNTESGQEEKAVLGKSAKAGQMAVGQSAASRVFTNVPTLIIPPLVMTLLEKRNAFGGPRGKAMASLTNLTLIGLSLGLFLPPAIAYYPQRAETDPVKLEDRFKRESAPVYFNKGL